MLVQPLPKVLQAATRLCSRTAQSVQLAVHVTYLCRAVFDESAFFREIYCGSNMYATISTWCFDNISHLYSNFHKYCLNVSREINKHPRDTVFYYAIMGDAATLLGLRVDDIIWHAHWFKIPITRC